ncbi:MAG: biotin-dependent carboxyltransferase family protein [Actinomycetota bacterium]
MGLEVLDPGLASSVQDLGRTGYYRYGIPTSGALDAFSALAANLLVGNDEGAAVIESTYTGPRLRFDAPAVVAVTGADMPVQINGTDVEEWTALTVDAGDELSFGFLTAGARIYIAVRGGIDVPEVLGSRSTYLLGGFGGHEGRMLRAGDRLSIGADPARPAGGQVPAELRPALTRQAEVRVVMGLYDYRLTDRGRSDFLGTTWTLTPVADRIGFRYTGGTLEWKERVQPFGAGADPSNIVDAGYPIGSIQVPSGAEPIVLHRDAVSGGGYAMIATVISADLDSVGQHSPGTQTRFVAVSLDEALQARAERNRRVGRLREAVG